MPTHRALPPTSFQSTYKSFYVYPYSRSSSVRFGLHAIFNSRRPTIRHFYRLLRPLNTRLFRPTKLTPSPRVGQPYNRRRYRHTFVFTAMSRNFLRHRLGHLLSRLSNTTTYYEATSVFFLVSPNTDATIPTNTTRQPVTPTVFHQGGTSFYSS